MVRTKHFTLALAMTGIAVSAGCGGASSPQDSAASQADQSSETVMGAADASDGQAAVAADRQTEMGSVIQAKSASDAQSKVLNVGKENPELSGRLESVTWPYGPCTDAASLIPPPLDGWGMHNDMSPGEWPIETDNARISYSYFDNSLEPNTPEYRASKQYAAIYVASDPSIVEALETMLEKPVFRETNFEPGPYNYPVRKNMASALPGKYIVQVDGKGDTADEYLARIIRCGIDSGLIAKGIDSASLRDTP